MNNLAESKKVNIILKTKLEEIEKINLNNEKNNLEKIRYKENDEKISINVNKESEQYIKIRNINANNLNDLDALYFWDKVEMKPQRS